MKGFYAGGALVLAALIFMTLQWRPGEEEITSFYGIVDTTETIVSAEIPVEIVHVHVTPGQRVRAGDTLLRLNSSELEKSIAELRYGLNEARMNRLTSDREIQVQVAELEAQYNLNRSLLAQVRGTDVGRDDRDAASPLRAAITGLRHMLDREEASTTEMEAYLELLQRERDKLTVVSAESGVVGSVNHRAGERVPAFSPILTLHNGAPSDVSGYIHESVHGRVEFGRKVRVRSLASPHEIQGEIVGIGHRIVEYPLRLRMRPDIQIWGREVTVRIPPENSFLLGEKVMITVEPGPAQKPDEGLDTRVSGPSPQVSSPPVSASGSASKGIWSLEGVEASGLIYLADLEKFWVISDDTPKKRPLLNIVNPAGGMEGTVTLAGLDKVNDMEAIAQTEDGTIYIATSMSHTKKGNHPKARRLLVRARREGTELRLDASVSLYEALKSALDGAEGDAGEWFRTAVTNRSLDLEGIAPHGEGLLLGFKAPLWKGRAVILRVHDRAGLLAGSPLDAESVSLWRTPELHLPESGAPCGVSDLFIRGNTLHVLGTMPDGDSGGWWTLELKENSAVQHVRSFRDEKPEGIAFDPLAGAYRVAIDAGDKHPSTVYAVSESASR